MNLEQQVAQLLEQNFDPNTLIPAIVLLHGHLSSEQTLDLATALVEESGADAEVLMDALDTALDDAAE